MMYGFLESKSVHLSNIARALKEDILLKKTFEGLKFITSHFGNIGVKALDRGYDDVKFFKYFTENEEQFVIRVKKNRNVIHNGKPINILKLANKYKGKYATLVKNKAGKVKKCKFSYITITLPDIPEFDYYALVDGIYAILKKSRTGIKNFIKPIFKIKGPQQLILTEAFI